MRPAPLARVLQGPRLKLVAHDPHQAPAMFAMVEANRQHLRFMPWTARTQSVADISAYIQLSQQGRIDGSMFDYSIFTGPNFDQYAGNIGMHSINWNHHRGEIGYWLASEFEGQGLMSDAVLLLEQAAFEEGFHRLEIRCSEDNLRSSRVALRNHYRLEATLRGDQWEREHFRNTMIFGKLSSEHFHRYPEATIRRAIPTDAANIHRVHMRSIQELCAQDYTAEQIKAWGHRSFNQEKWHQAIAQSMVWVIDQGGNIVGMANTTAPQDVDNKGRCLELQALYFAPEIKGQGFGRRMLERIESWARSEGVTRIQLNSTTTSLPFYLKMGYQQTSRDKILFKIGGVGVDCYPMEKVLAP